MDDLLMLEPPIAFLDDEPSPATRPRPWWRRAASGVASGLEWLMGAATLVFGLSALASLPVAQFLSLGYLLEASGRVARGGRLRDGWIGVRRAARVGGIVAGGFLSTLPARFVSSLATSAELIDPGGPVARGWRAALLGVVLLTLGHVTAACARGGRLRHFAWPPGNLIWLARRLRSGGLYLEARDATWSFIEALRLPHYFRLGLLGFVGSMAWLVIPAGLLAAGHRFPPLGVIGAVGLGVVAMSLPFLQARYAAEGRFVAIFEVKAVRERFRRAPWAFAAAFLVTVAAAVPLYLLKIEVVPSEAAWLPSLFFVAFLFPARLIDGWAYDRGGRQPARRHWTARGVGRLAMLPIAIAYVLIVTLAQYTSWGGSRSLFEQHAFLLPAPFSGF